MSNLMIDLANHIVENEPLVSFEEAMELIENMDEGSLAALIGEFEKEGN